jgi:hypothetical protein
MGYDVKLVDPVSERVLQLEELKAEFNITCNYKEHFVRTLGEKGVRAIYGMTGAASLPILDNAINQLKENVDDNYWAPTEGNAKRALLCLKILAEKLPNGIWQGN